MDNKKKKSNKSVKPKRSGDFKAKTRSGRPFDKNIKKKSSEPLPKFSDEVRLNKYLSNAGICSRREADVLIESGVVSVNGNIVTEMGYKVKQGDVVKYDGATLNAEKKRYVLLNKPKDFVTTNTDAWGRKSVMGLLAKACREPIMPVDKLDKDTTGLMLCTNDTDLEKKLNHPSQKVLKIYQVSTDKAVNVEHIEKLRMGVQVDDLVLKAEKVSYVDGKTSRDIGVELYAQKRQTVVRMFEKLGYKVIKLDRVSYAGLTKKDLPRGHFRHLTDQEVAFLKMS